MTRASVAELKAKLSEYIARAKAGEEVLVTERGRPVAKITPLTGGAADEARLDELVRAGLVRPPERELPADILTRELPPDPTGAALRALLEEREEGR